MTKLLILMALLQTSLFLALERASECAEPFRLEGRSLYVVNTNDKSCSPVEFRKDGSFTLKTNSEDIKGTYKYTKGLLVTKLQTGAVFQRLRFQESRENGGKEAI